MKQQNYGEYIKSNIYVGCFCHHSLQLRFGYTIIQLPVLLSGPVLGSGLDLNLNRSSSWSLRDWQIDQGWTSEFLLDRN